MGRLSLLKDIFKIFDVALSHTLESDQVTNRQTNNNLRFFAPAQMAHLAYGQISHVKCYTGQKKLHVSQ